MKQLVINNLKLKNPILLAPMVDITDLPYRLICRKFGCSLAYTEMLYISAILHENQKTKNLMRSSPEDKPLGIQITGNSINEFKKVVPYLKKYDLTDLNCGCPSIRITGNQAGSYLLKNPGKISEMIKILKSKDLTVSAKIRLGYKKNNVIKIAKTIEKAGADALTLHPRLATQGKSIPADHRYTKKLKSILSIPLIANGDIFTPKKAESLLDFADGIMIARGAIGNPLIFKQILHYLRTKKHLSLSSEQIQKQNINQFQEYLQLTEKHNLIDINRIKYLGSNFIKSFHNAPKLRQQLMHLKTLEEIKKLIVNLT
jgi:tRNA-dihydrouridine synthase B